MTLPAPPDRARERLATEPNVWLATVRPDGRPHLVPIWFVFVDGRFAIATSASSVKVHNLLHNPQVALSLENGYDVLICEGRAEPLTPPLPPAVVAAFQQKYDWTLTGDSDASFVFQVTPLKWLTWQANG